MTNRRDFLKKAGVATAAAAGATTLAAPAVHAQAPIKWRLQTYAGAALAEHVIKPAIDDPAEHNFSQFKISHRCQCNRQFR